jgi:hypothetical protein
MHVIPLVLALLASESLVAPAGTRVEVRLQSSITTRVSAAGDEVLAVLTKPILAGNALLIPKGSLLHGRVETIAAATQSSVGRVRIVFREIELADGRRTSTWITNSFTASAPNRTLRYFLYPGAGGIAGALIGGSALRAAGIIGGSLIGFIVAINSGTAKLSDLTLSPGKILHLQLGEDLVLR